MFYSQCKTVINTFLPRLCLVATKAVEKNIISRQFHLTSFALMRGKDDRKIWQKSLPKKDEGIQGVNYISDDIFTNGECEFPDLTTPDRLYDGETFSSLPILNIKVSRNNTLMLLSDEKGYPLLRRSCGVEGFKNCRKGTNVAAQATAVTLSKQMLQKGYKTIRVCIKGLGPGRMASIQGLMQGGMNIISITDTSSFSTNPPRPRKARRL